MSTGRNRLDISATDLAIGYGNRVVVPGVNLAVERGMTFALVGTNGSGKSTLLKTMAGLLGPLQGTISVLGARPGRLPAKIAYLGQFHPSQMILPLRVVDVVRMARFSSLGLLSRPAPEDERKVQNAIELMGLCGLENEPLNALSGGQQQRAFLAQALARDAQVLLLDEPETNLDASGRDAYSRAIRSASEECRTVVVCTHDIEEASRCDQAMLLAQRVVAYGAGATVLTAETLLSTFGLTARLSEGRVVVVERDHRRECQE
jgi:ABC-type Mn2+/Zn2+ transport system ATPase subunit